MLTFDYLGDGIWGVLQEEGHEIRVWRNSSYTTLTGILLDARMRANIGDFSGSSEKLQISPAALLIAQMEKDYQKQI